MKVAVTADVHVHAWQEHSVLVDGVPSRLRDCVSVLSSVRRYCKNHDICNVIIAGDLFHKRGVIHTQAYNLVVEELTRFKKNGVEVYVLPGNHD